MSLKYHQLDSSVEKQIKENISKGILSSYRFMDENAVRRNMEKDKNSVLRPSFGRDIEKILHLPLYNRYNDKTQVFSFYNNDDITRRGLHVQLVSRISRNIGRMLGLNLDLISHLDTMLDTHLLATQENVISASFCRKKPDGILIIMFTVYVFLIFCTGEI